MVRHGLGQSVVRGEDRPRGGGGVLDAFIVARALHQGGMTDRKWDVTGDGTVSSLDVDAIAAVAVSIVEGSKS